MARTSLKVSCKIPRRREFKKWMTGISLSFLVMNKDGPTLLMVRDTLSIEDLPCQDLRFKEEITFKRIFLMGKEIHPRKLNNVKQPNSKHQ